MRALSGVVSLLLVTILLSGPALAQTAMLEGSAVYRNLNATGPLPTEEARSSTIPPTAPQSAAPTRSYDNHSINRPRTAVRLHSQEPHTVYLKDTRTFWQRHPMVKGVAIGAGAGAGAGALTGLISHQGILRGAAIGAGTGAGVGVIRTSQIMKRHPIARDAATGAATGLGIGWAGSRRPGIALAGTGIGSAIGLGTGLFTQLR
jgi:hypothetical protein